MAHADGRNPAGGAPARAAKGPARKRVGPLVERIVVLRVVLVVFAIALLVLFVRAAMTVFGGDREARRIERAIDRALRSDPAPPR